MSALCTVIVPCYNMEKTISACLDSLVNQTSQELEILVIDDRSKDRTAEIVKEYQMKYPQVRMIQKENGGISSARNCGLENIRTPYFGFVDSDDTVESDMFETMLAKIQEENSDLCVCNFIWEWPDHKRYHDEQIYYTEKEMMTRLMATLWNKVYRTDILSRFNLSFPIGYRYEDACFLYCLAANPLKISFVKNYFVHYIQREGSITHTNNEKVRDMIEVFQRISNYYKDRNLDQVYYQELEFLYAKFFLGNSFLRAAQIKDKNERKNVLKLHWDTLTETYPNFRYNPYLKKLSATKKVYYGLISKKTYQLIGEVLHVAYQLKGGL